MTDSNGAKKEIQFVIETGQHLGKDIIDVVVFRGTRSKGKIKKSENLILLAETFKNGDSVDALIKELQRMKKYIECKVKEKLYAETDHKDTKEAA